MVNIIIRGRGIKIIINKIIKERKKEGFQPLGKYRWHIEWKFIKQYWAYVIRKVIRFICPRTLINRRGFWFNLRLVSGRWLRWIGKWRWISLSEDCGDVLHGKLK